jgi:hypothetical protein
MKNPHLGDFFLWEGKPAKVIGESEGHQVMIELLEDQKCPHCNGLLGKHAFQVIVSSPLFQQSAEQIPTIEDDDSLIVS